MYIEEALKIKQPTEGRQDSKTQDRHKMKRPTKGRQDSKTKDRHRQGHKSEHTYVCRSGTAPYTYSRSSWAHTLYKHSTYPGVVREEQDTADHDQTRHRQTGRQEDRYSWGGAEWGGLCTR